MDKTKSLKILRMLETFTSWLFLAIGISVLCIRQPLNDVDLTVIVCLFVFMVLSAFKTIDKRIEVLEEKLKQD